MEMAAYSGTGDLKEDNTFLHIWRKLVSRLFAPCLLPIVHISHGEPVPLEDRALHGGVERPLGAPGPAHGEVALEAAEAGGEVFYFPMIV